METIFPNLYWGHVVDSTVYIPKKTSMVNTNVIRNSKALVICTIPEKCFHWIRRAGVRDMKL